MIRQDKSQVNCYFAVTGSHGKLGGGQTHAEAPQNKRARVNSSGDSQNKGQEASADHEPTCLSGSGKKMQAHSQENYTPTRGWYHPPTHGHHKRKPGSGFDFSLMSYNVLAQELLMANWYLYLDCADQDRLTWNVRKEKLLQEFQHYNVDVLCLQEVQESHYHDFFLPELQKLGYEGLYKKRTGDKPDGCATFYRTSKFSLVKHRLVEYYRPGTDVLDRDNVAIVVLLKPKTGKRKMHSNLCIANTHLLFNKRRGDVKLSQLGVLLAEIDQLAFDTKVRYWDAKVRCHPVVLCGDLNSAPFSPLYQFLNAGQLAYSEYERSEISGQSSPPRWRNWMQPPLWPAFVGITDHCQYHQAVLERGRQATLANAQKDVSVTSTSNTAHQSPSEDHLQYDSDTPIASPLSVSSDAQSNPDDRPEAVKSEEEQGSCNDPVEQPLVPSDKFSTSETVVEESGGQTFPSSSDPTVSAPTPQVPPFSPCIFHPFNLRSVYSHFTVDHEPEVTTHHGRANCTVDYILYTARVSIFEGDHTGKGRRYKPRYRDGKLKLLSRLTLPSDKELERMGSLPNKEHPSDHLPLIAKFRLTDK
ncbi:protein angel homolog 2-like [Branchiostoma lanceolatum]|uniref:protein angel homolog 2-like n=1 Tax=Branchiostoma lanceolatum TaxID=7740 RepID=UPI003453493B